MEVVVFLMCLGWSCLMLVYLEFSSFKVLFYLILSSGTVLHSDIAIMDI